MMWFQVLLFNTINSIQYHSFACTQLNCIKYCYLTLNYSLNINHLLKQR